MERFKQDDHTCYQYFAPNINLSYLVDLFSELYIIKKEIAQSIIDEFVYDEKTKKDDRDIFTRPLIKVNKNKVILCQTLIEHMNMNRNIEKVLQRRKVKLQKIGTDYEKYIIEKLKENEYV